MKAWMLSFVFYLVGIFATALVPLPALGLTRDFVISMHLDGTGLWIDHPETVIAFGAFYFAAQSMTKFALSGNVAVNTTTTNINNDQY